MENNKKEKTLLLSQNTNVTTTIAFVVFIVGALATGITWINSTQNKIENMTEVMRDHDAEIGKLKTESTNSQIKFTEIQTQLKSMDITLVEIKESVKRGGQ